MHKKLFFVHMILGMLMLASVTVSYAAKVEQEPKIFNFGVITLTHPLVIYRQYLPFVDYLNLNLPWEFNLVLYKEYAEVVDAIENGELDMALLGGDSFAVTIENTVLQPVAAVLSRDKTTKTYSMIVTKEDNTSINTVADLSGKSMAFGPLQSTSSYVVPAKFLAKNHIQLSDFIKYSNLNSHDAVLRAVLRGDYDAGAVSEAFAQRFLGHGLKVVGVTEKFPSFLIVAGINVPQKVRDSVATLLLKIQADSEEFINMSQEWPEILRNGFAPVVVKDYDVFEHLPRKSLNTIAP